MEQDLYDFHRDMQFDHWWFRGRAKIVQSFLDTQMTESGLGILDIGSGFGALHPILRKWGKVDALEPHQGAHEMLRVMCDGEIFNISDFPAHFPDKKYGLVTMFDVLEHIEDDRRALSVIHNGLLGEKGKLVITVPAYQWLWTERDTINRHFRRYGKGRIRKLLREAGFKNIRISYFMTFLFPIAVVQRLLCKITRSSGEDLKTPKPVLNYLFSLIFGAERHLLRFMNLPFGLSLIAVAEK